MILRLFSIPLICTVLTAHAELNDQQQLAQDKTWNLVKDKQAIQVYTLEVPGSSILKVRTGVTINYSMDHIQSIIDDVEHRPNWIPYLKYVHAEQQPASRAKLEYAHFSAPWPATDRDFVYQITLLQQDDNQLIYDMKSVTHTTLPEKSDIIRAELIESRYILTSLDNNRTRVELIFHANPRGWLPDWIINIIQRTLPYLILRNLRAEAIKNNDK